MNANVASGLSGFAAGVVLMVAVGASTTSTPPGRFQITSAANYLAVIDTETGQVWAGNFNQLGPGAPALEFKNCPQSTGDLFRAKTE